LTWPTGPSVYQVAMMQELRVFRPIPYELVLDGDLLRTAAMLVAVGNGPSYGAGMRICPAADLTDGLLDVTIVRPMPTWKFLRIFPSVYRGEHVRSPDVMTARAATVSLSAPGLTAYADGEPLGPLPVTLESVPAALTAFVPARGGIE
jgi:diacylglycerol kinase (ATP)